MAIKPGRREALLIAIAKACNWMNDLADGRVAGFAAIARREGKAERHIRLLAPLAFLSPRIVSVLLDGTAPGHLTVTRLARALPYSWAEQEQQSIAPTYSQLGCEPGGLALSSVGGRDQDHHRGLAPQSLSGSGFKT